jgi:hypothetical protein
LTGSGLMDFLIAVVGLCIIVYLIFLALDFIAPDERFKMIARYAVGGTALLVFLVAIKGVLFGGGAGAMAITPVAVIEFAIGLIVVMVVLFIIYYVIDFMAPGNLSIPIKYVVGALALIAILVVAEKALFGGGLGFISSSGFHTQLTK